MLTDKDLLSIQIWRGELIKNRTVPIYINVEIDGGKHPLTGEKLPGKVESYEVDAVVTERASRTDGERNLRNRDEDYGTLDYEGDLWFSVAIDQIEAIHLALDFETDTKLLDAMKTVEYDHEEYAIVSTDKKGIGYRNRVEFLAKRVL